MENLENKIIAEKLNSLRELPLDYSPNINSKWELIQSGRSATSSSSLKRGWLFGMLLLFCVAVIIWKLMPSKPVTINYATNTIRQSEIKQTSKENTLVPTVIGTIQTASIRDKNSSATRDKKSVLNKANDIIPQPFNRTIAIPDSFSKKQPDTLKFQTPVAEVDLKPKKKIYQRDFESIVTITDTTNRKTAHKGFQIKLSSQTNKEPESGRQPSLRLQQNF